MVLLFLLLLILSHPSFLQHHFPFLPPTPEDGDVDDEGDDHAAVGSSPASCSWEGNVVVTHTVVNLSLYLYLYLYLYPAMALSYSF